MVHNCSWLCSRSNLVLYSSFLSFFIFIYIFFPFPLFCSAFSSCVCSIFRLFFTFFSSYIHAVVLAFFASFLRFLTFIFNYLLLFINLCSHHHPLLYILRYLLIPFFIYLPFFLFYLLDFVLILLLSIFILFSFFCHSSSLFYFPHFIYISFIHSFCHVCLHSITYFISFLHLFTHSLQSFSPNNSPS